MKVKTVIGIHLVNEMIRSGWQLMNVKFNGSKPEFLMLKEDEVPRKEIRASRRDV